MGGGSYNSISAYTRSNTTYKQQSREQKFSQHRLDPEMDPNMFNYRESRDNGDKEAYPIIIALDETGSMGRIPDHLITDLLPSIMERIMEAGIEHPQVCFVGVGDCMQCYEQAPLQVGQFEASDELMEKWLKKIYLEGRGGGNGGESYNLVWYLAAKMIRTDSWEKRQKKGCLITIGDESCHGYIPGNAIAKYTGKAGSRDIYTKDILKCAQKEWNVYHIHCQAGCYPYKTTNWQQLLGDNALISLDAKADDLAQLIPEIVKKSYNQTKTSFEGVEAGD